MDLIIRRDETTHVREVDVLIPGPEIKRAMIQLARAACALSCTASVQVYCDTLDLDNLNDHVIRLRIELGSRNNLPVPTAEEGSA